MQLPELPDQPDKIPMWMWHTQGVVNQQADSRRRNTLSYTPQEMGLIQQKLAEQEAVLLDHCSGFQNIFNWEADEAARWELSNAAAQALLKPTAADLLASLLSLLHLVHCAVPHARFDIVWEHHAAKGWDKPAQLDAKLGKQLNQALRDCLRGAMNAVALTPSKAAQQDPLGQSGIPSLAAYVYHAITAYLFIAQSLMTREQWLETYHERILRV